MTILQAPSRPFMREVNFNIKKTRTKEEKVKAEDMRQKAREEDSRMVKGIFKNLDAPGGSLTFSYKKYKEDPVRTYELQDGETYEIPIGVAKHLNTSCVVPEREYARNEKGEQQLYTVIKRKRQRYQFLSTEYM